jgi:DNA-binding transcriptional regulator YiaG
MNVQDLRDHYNTKSNPQLARKLGVGRTTIWDWEKKGIPLDKQARLQLLTGGKLKANLKALSTQGDL